MVSRPGATACEAPASANAIVVFLLALGAALEGYALSQAGGPEPGRSESLIWAIVGVAVVFTAWALRARYWWSVSGVISIALVGIAMGTYAALSLLGGTYSEGTRLDLIGIVAIGVAGIILMGLLSSSWTWLMTTVKSSGPSRARRERRSRHDGRRRRLSRARRCQRVIRART